MGQTHKFFMRFASLSRFSFRFFSTATTEAPPQLSTTTTTVSSSFDTVTGGGAVVTRFTTLQGQLSKDILDEALVQKRASIITGGKVYFFFSFHFFFRLHFVL